MPKTVSRYKYDKQGRTKKTITVTESEWDDLQAGWMLALEAWRLSHCPGCGEPLSECTAEENDGNYQVTDIRCHACASMTRFSVKFKEDPASGSVRYRVTKRG